MAAIKRKEHPFSVFTSGALNSTQGLAHPGNVLNLVTSLAPFRHLKDAFSSYTLEPTATDHSPHSRNRMGPRPRWQQHAQSYKARTENAPPVLYCGWPSYQAGSCDVRVMPWEQSPGKRPKGPVERADPVCVPNTQCSRGLDAGVRHIFCSANQWPRVKVLPLFTVLG